MKQAFILKNLLENDAYATQTDLAKHLGMSRARVTQTGNLLKLAPKILDAFLNQPDNQVHLFSERRLRPITQILSQKKQRAAFRKLLGRLGTNATPFKARSSLTDDQRHKSLYDGLHHISNFCCPPGRVVRTPKNIGYFVRQKFLLAVFSLICFKLRLARCYEKWYSKYSIHSPLMKDNEYECTAFV